MFGYFNQKQSEKATERWPFDQPAEAKPEEDKYFLGLDLGQVQDFSALVALRRTEAPAQAPVPIPVEPTNDKPDKPLFTTRGTWDGQEVIQTYTPPPAPVDFPKKRYRFEVRGLKRWALRTSYHDIVTDVAQIVSREPLAGCTLGIDATGVGAGVFEIVRNARPKAKLKRITITGGLKPDLKGGDWRIPKLELVSTVVALLESGRLAIPDTIPEAVTLGRELQAFKARVTTAGHETMEADWRTRQHDDMVLALAIAAYVGNTQKQFFIV